MQPTHPLSGVYAAAVTPLEEDDTISLDGLQRLLAFLAGRGCHGALLFGTTGEGPSFTPQERLAALRSALEVRASFPGFRLLVGTGTPSLEETVELTRAVFDLGADGVVVLPPYYYRKVSDDGLFAWYSQVLGRAAPPTAAFLGYHIPPVSGVALSLDLLARLKDAFPDRFAGLKDSSADSEHARRLGERFGRDLVVLNGTDSLFQLALENGAAGCITALANLASPDLRRIWDADQKSGEPDAAALERVQAARGVMNRYSPAPPALKALLARWHGFPRWALRPPLLPLPPAVEESLLADLAAVAALPA